MRIALTAAPVQRTVIALLTADYHALQGLAAELFIKFADIASLKDRFRKSLGFPLCRKWLTIDPRRALQGYLPPEVLTYYIAGDAAFLTAKRYSESILATHLAELQLHQNHGQSVSTVLGDIGMHLSRVDATMEFPNGHHQISNRDGRTVQGWQDNGMSQHILDEQVFSRLGTASHYVHLRTADTQGYSGCDCPHGGCFRRTCRVHGIQHLLAPVQLLMDPVPKAANIVGQWLLLYKLCGKHGIPSGIEVGHSVFQHIWDFVRL